MGDFQKLEAWKRAHALALNTYRACASMPPRDKYELTSQMRRAAVSIVSNIAEGDGRNSAVEFARFLRVAVGSANELTTQLLLARDLGALGSDEVECLMSETARVRRMLSGLIRRLSSKPIADNRKPIA
jgi:four helix bundle protein